MRILLNIELPDWDIVGIRQWFSDISRFYITFMNKSEASQPYSHNLCFVEIRKKPELLTVLWYFFVVFEIRIRVLYFCGYIQVTVRSINPP